MIASHEHLTQLCARFAAGERQAGEDLFAKVYDELRRIAGQLMRREKSEHTLQPTALVNEAFIRLAHQHEAVWNDRQHFFAIAATFMRRILVDHARQKMAAKRGEGKAMLTLDEALMAEAGLVSVMDLLALEEALLELQGINARCAHVVELKFFAGLDNDEIARIQDTSPATVKRDWAFAKAWLYRRLHGDSTS